MDEPTKEEIEESSRLIVSYVQITSQEIFDKLQNEKAMQVGCSDLLAERNNLDFGTPKSNAKHAAFADLSEEDQIEMVKRGEI